MQIKMGDLSSFKTLSIVLLGFLSVLSILANGFCINIIRKSKELSRTPSSYLIRSLLTVHFIQGLFVFPLYMAKKMNVESVFWYRVICDSFRFTFMATFYMAIVCMVLIALDRVFAVAFVMRYRTFVTKSRVLSCIFFLWLYIILLCLCPFDHPEGHPAMEGIFHNRSTTFVSKCHYNQSHIWTVSMLIYNCVVPYVFIVAAYQFIIYRIKKLERSRKFISPIRTLVENLHDKEKVRLRKTRNVTKISFVLSMTYLITWSPSVLYYLLWSMCPERCFVVGYKQSEEEKYFGFFTKYLAFLDCVASPIIYCIFSKQFRHFVPCFPGGKRSNSWILSHSKASHSNISNVTMYRSTHSLKSIFKNS